MLLRNRIGAAPLYLILVGGLEFLYTLNFTVNLVYHVETVGLNPLQIVLVGTFLEVVCFLGEVPTGVIADVYSRRLSIIIGVCLVGVGFVIEGSFPTFVMILAAQVFWGIGATFLSGATEAWIADEAGADRAGPLFIRGAQVGSVAALVAAVISVGLASIDLWVPIVISGVSMLVLGLFLSLCMPEHGFTPAPREERNTFGAMAATFMQGTRAVRARPVLLTILAISLLFGLFSEGFDRLWTPHLLENFTLPSLGPFKPVVWFGLIAVASSLLSIAANEAINRNVSMSSHRAVARTLYMTDALLIAGLFVFALAGNLALAIAAFLLASAARSLHYPLSTVWANQNVDSRVRATVLSMNGQMNALGQIVGGPIIGLIGRNISIRAALVTSAAILTPVFGLYSRTLRRTDAEMVDKVDPQEQLLGGK